MSNIPSNRITLKDVYYEMESDFARGKEATVWCVGQEFYDRLQKQMLEESAHETPARREYHANGTYWSGVPTVDLPCDFCGRGIVDHDPRTHACSSVETSADQKSPAGPSATNSVACESEHPVAGAGRHLQGCAVRQAECDCGAYDRWICPKCGTVNGLDKSSCLGCGREKPKPAHEDCPF